MSMRKKFKIEYEAIQYLKDSIAATWNKLYQLLLKINCVSFKKSLGIIFFPAVLNL